MKSDNSVSLARISFSIKRLRHGRLGNALKERQQCVAQHAGHQSERALVGLAEGRVGGGDGVAVHRGSLGRAFRHGALNRSHRPLDPGAPGADHTPLIATWAAAPLWHVPAP